MNGTAAVRTTLKAELLRQIERLDRQQALFPMGTPDIDRLIQQLEPLTPYPTPLQQPHQENLTGTWALLYASRGTVVTRQVASAPSGRLASIQIRRIWQQLHLGPQATLQAINAAILELPLFGTWQLTAMGTWVKETDDRTAKVSFEAFGFQAIDILGQSEWKLPELKIPVLEAFRNEAVWITSYLDEDLRVGRGATGNLFVFRRELAAE